MIYQLFKKLKVTHKKQYFQKALHIHNQLLKGKAYQKIGGKQLRLTPKYIRFRLGEYRLIFQKTSNGYIPCAFIPRKHLSLFLNRR